MKVYTISNSQITPGVVPDQYSVTKPAEDRTIRLGDYGPNSKHIPMFKKNVPEIIRVSAENIYGLITDAHPIKVDGGYALAKPNQESTDVLVVIRMGNRYENRQCVKVGMWSFNSITVPTPKAIEQTLAQGYGSATFEDQKKIGWHDALIIMKEGDSLTLHERTGDITHVKYVSAETGFVIDTRVRMILQDYDVAPDGEGTYIKLNSVFPSMRAALQYRSRYMANMYWGRIETLDGMLVQTVEERHDHQYD